MLEEIELKEVVARKASRVKQAGQPEMKLHFRLTAPQSVHCCAFPTHLLYENWRRVRFGHD